MSNPLIDITGQRFGRLTALELTAPPGGYATTAYWRCLCSCGARVVVQGGHLRSGATKSCGCYRGDAARQRHLATRPVSIEEHW